MNETKKNIVGGIITFTVIMIVLSIFLYTLITKSSTKEKGTIKVEQLTNTVSIYRDRFGVPHIIAENDNDLFFAFGYSTAQDRLWQMDIQRRLGEGKLSEIFGNETVELDVFMRTLGIETIAEKIEQNLSQQSREILQAYTNGINYYINENKKKLQVEFDILNYDPDPWQIKHSLIIYRLFAWHMSSNWWTDLITTEMCQKIGILKTNSLFNSSIGSIGNISVTTVLDNLIRITTKSREYYSLHSPSLGSSYAVSSQKSESNKSVLAINFDFLMNVPSAWYQASLHSRDINVIGLTLPGIPCIMIGNNEKTGWGFSNGTIDDCDYYSETVDTLGINNYFFNNTWHRLSIKQEKVIVKQSEPLEFSVYSTNKGPIISNAIELKPSFDYREDIISNKIIPLRGDHISIKWSGTEITDDILGFLLLNKSQNIIELQEALKLIQSPALQFIFCDESNIGSKLTGLVPIRSFSNSNIVLSGNSPEYIWKNFITHESLPLTINPVNKYIVTAPNKLSTKIDFNTYNNSSSERITQLLNSKELVSIEDVKNIQNDVLAHNAQILLPIILNILESKNDNDYYYSQSITYLKNWDYLMKKSSIPALIYNTLIFKILKNTLADDLGDKLFEKLCFIPTLTNNIISQLITGNSGSWFDDLNILNQVETKNEIIYRSFIETLNFLKSELCSETKNWRWAELHQLTLTHPLSNYKHLNKIFNVGPFEQNGSITSINSSYYDYSIPFKQVTGVSARFICDMANPYSSLSIISSGACGDPFSKNYNNQTALLIDGYYITLYNQKEIIISSNFKHLKLLPKE